MADTDCISEAASSICDEERVRKLFQACDANGDGYIDSHDLLTVCRELSLEDSLDELMLQLGADAQGRISYEQFLERRLALRPEIDALKGSKRESITEDKLDSWEWDSGARDMSPVPKSLIRKSHNALADDELKFVRLAGSAGAESCLTTYVFNPVDSCTPSPEQLTTSTCTPQPDGVRTPETLRAGSSLTYDRKSLGHANYMAEYELELDLDLKAQRQKEHSYGLYNGAGHEYGQLYTISKEERTYDEPFVGELRAPRSWLCCPGTGGTGGQQRLEQPPLLDKSPTATGTTIKEQPILQAPSPQRIFCAIGCERLQLQLDEQAQRYEEQLTELHSVIAELTRKLHQQRAMAIVEEDETSEVCTSVHDDSITCPLEVSELEQGELSDIDNKLPLSESPLELPEPKLTSSQHTQNASTSPHSDLVDGLKQEIAFLKTQLLEYQTKLAHVTLSNNLCHTDDENKCLESPESHIETDCDSKLPEQKEIKYGNIVPIHKTGVKSPNMCGGVTVTKMAERIKLKRATDGQRVVNPNDLVNGDLSTVVAEHIVGDILKQCDVQSERQAVDIELRRLGTKLEHARSQNSVLALTLSETKAHCDRLALLCGKYESNAIALRLALGVTDRTIEAYDVLLALLETEVALSDEVSESLENRSAAETVARQLLSHLDEHQSTDVLLSPWQNNVYGSPTAEKDDPWTTGHENRLREHVSRLKAERSNIQGTYVALESTQIENAPIRPSSSQESRKIDLEMAVLMQELMGLREEKSELISRLFLMEKEKSAMEVKLKYVEGQQRAQGAALKNLQGQLKDTEALLALASQNRDSRGYSDAEHAQGVELELMQALAREARLKVRLQELVNTLEQVTKNAEARLLEGREIVQDLNHTNSILADTVDRNNKKYQSKFKKMEQQMISLVERHAVQVQSLQHKIASLESPTACSENSNSSVAV